MKSEDFERTLRRLQLQNPSPELRQRILAACNSSAVFGEIRPLWTEWWVEVILAASIVFLVATLTAVGPPPTPSDPIERVANTPSPTTATEIDLPPAMQAGFGSSVAIRPAIPDWPPPVQEIEDRLASELRIATHRAGQGEPPC